ncbi:hypothetical protein CEXT_759641 [Caerostris extrusa]|uniref:Uncharacterized protein n=1 Tax=Caerostris extrusa TaxID=172846 RepID=A0AAV4NYS5_CAEEX|nr:hypothetical protein CEXT_759641 [Caerostris extrusa]
MHSNYSRTIAFIQWMSHHIPKPDNLKCVIKNNSRETMNHPRMNLLWKVTPIKRLSRGLASTMGDNKSKNRVFASIFPEKKRRDILRLSIYRI